MPYANDSQIDVFRRYNYTDSYPNGTLYLNETLSNATQCYVLRPPYVPVIFDNGTVVGTGCSSPVNPLKSHAISGIAFAALFILLIPFCIASLYKHGKRAWSAASIVYPYGKRWEFYWQLITCAIVVASSFFAIDIDRAIVQGGSTGAFCLFWSASLPVAQAAVWELSRNWAQIQHDHYRQVRPHIAVAEFDRRRTSKIHFWMPLGFYAIDFLALFLTALRPFGNAYRGDVAKATDPRFKLGAVFSILAWLMTLWVIGNCIYVTRPHVDWRGTGIDPDVEGARNDDVAEILGSRDRSAGEHGEVVMLDTIDSAHAAGEFDGVSASSDDKTLVPPSAAGRSAAPPRGFDAATYKATRCSRGGMLAQSQSPAAGQRLSFSAQALPPPKYPGEAVVERRDSVQSAATSPALGTDSAGAAAASTGRRGTADGKSIQTTASSARQFMRSYRPPAWSAIHASTVAFCQFALLIRIGYTNAMMSDYSISAYNPQVNVAYTVLLGYLPLWLALAAMDVRGIAEDNVDRRVARWKKISDKLAEKQVALDVANKRLAGLASGASVPSHESTAAGSADRRRSDAVTRGMMRSDVSANWLSTHPTIAGAGASSSAGGANGAGAGGGKGFSYVVEPKRRLDE